MSESSAFWLVWAFGFGVGFAYRLWGERRAAKHDAPAWITLLGYSLVDQFKSVDEGHKFAGDRVTVISRKHYSGGGRGFVVKVERDAAAEVE